MRKALLLGVPAAGLAALMLLTTIITTTRPRSATAQPTTCLPTSGPVSAASGPTRSDAGQLAASLDQQQRRVAGRIITIGQQRGISPRGWQIALQAGYTESRLRQVDHGHADSVGVFQIRGMHGSMQQRMDVTWQINWFYDTLLAVPGWKTMRPGTAAQAVEGSAFPHRYHEWEALASVLITQFAGTIDPSGCAGMASGAQTGQQVQAVLAFARQQLGEPYAWGAEGPNSWDCSSLVQAAYARVNITLPRVSHQQYEAGKHVPLAQAQPGDLVFWGADRDPELIHHVGLYLGGDRVLHAPQPGETVEITNMWDNGQLLNTATRPAAHV